MLHALRQCQFARHTAIGSPREWQLAIRHYHAIVHKVENGDYPAGSSYEQAKFNCTMFIVHEVTHYIDIHLSNRAS